VVWIEDDTLKTTNPALATEEVEEDDSDFTPESGDEEDSADDESFAEDEEDEDEEDAEYESEEDTNDSKQQTISIPKGADVSVKLHIHSFVGGGGGSKFMMQEEESEDEQEDEEEEEEEFIDYLMNKYAPRSKIGGKRKKNGKDKEEEPALELNDDEADYYEDLSKAKRRKLNEEMKTLSKLMTNTDVPYKFKVMGMPIANSIKASVIHKIDMFNSMSEDDDERHKLQTWLDGFMRVPFDTQIPLPARITDGTEKCSKFLSESRKTMDQAVYGMTAAKTQVMQVLAQWISNPESVGNVIALKGPMGVGKTSFAKNGVAKVLNRPFEFFSLGGATDSSTYVGHSYTYVGSTWGAIADSLIRNRCMNPVLYFDEVDKISTTAQGEEIAGMLIHLTDRSQNSQFHDKYFAGIDFDMSKCLFVFSFNDESKVHPILRDRMQVINCSGYTPDEKKIIVKQYVCPQVLERIRLTDQLTLSDEAIKFLISEYSAEEEGVRNLIRIVETLVMRINLLRIADEETAKSYKFYQKVTLPCAVDVTMARHILSDSAPAPTNESWRRIYV
jgi:ATP-dependent Lon protease